MVADRAALGKRRDTLERIARRARRSTRGPRGQVGSSGRPGEAGGGARTGPSSSHGIGSGWGDRAAPDARRVWSAVADCWREPHSRRGCDARVGIPPGKPGRQWARRQRGPRGASRGSSEPAAGRGAEGPGHAQAHRKEPVGASGVWPGKELPARPTRCRGGAARAEEASLRIRAVIGAGPRLLPKSAAAFGRLERV